MSNEATVRCSLQIRVGNISYSSQPTGFNADVTGKKGPCPGAVTVAVAGTNIDLSQLVTPGLCRIQNLDETNTVEYGIYYTSGSLFFPLGELLPGESYILRLSRNIQEDYYSTTGTSAEVNSLRFKANGAPCNVLVEAFEV